MAGQRIIVTVGAGKAGRRIVTHLVERGDDVVDARRPEQPACRCLAADLTDLGQTIDAISPHATGDRAPNAGVIHMAAIPRPHGAARISNRRARQVLGWKQEFFLH